MSLLDVIAAMSVPPVPQGAGPREPNKSAPKQRGTPSSPGSPKQVEVLDTEVFSDRCLGAVSGGGMPPEWTQGHARLLSMKPPATWPEDRWPTLLEDSRRFLGIWAPQAAALGWTTSDLFGCDPYAPWARVDAQGLILMINGDTVEAITRDSATIRTETGSIQRYYRNHGSQCPPIWTLEDNHAA